MTLPAHLALLNAELRKLATLPAPRWTIALTWSATALIAYAAHRAAPTEDPVLLALRWTQAGFLILGVLAATQEYEPGAQIRATLLAAPRRFPLAAAKALAVATAALLTATPLLAAVPHPATTALYLITVTLFGAACGALTRNPLGAAAASLTAYLVAFPLLRARFPDTAGWLPDTFLPTPSPAAAATATTWAALLTAIAALTLHRRNA